MRRTALLLGAATLALGVAAEWYAYSGDEPRRWLPDLAVGLVLVGGGLAAWEQSRERGAGALLAASGLAWFLGNFDASALYVHRGPLVHLLLTYPGWRPRSRLDTVAVATGYAAAFAAPIWRSDVGTLVLVGAL